MFVFALHAWLGLLAVGGVLLVVALALLNEVTTRRPLSEAAGLELPEGWRRQFPRDATAPSVGSADESTDGLLPAATGWGLGCREPRTSAPVSPAT